MTYATQPARAVVVVCPSRMTAPYSSVVYLCVVEPCVRPVADGVSILVEHAFGECIRATLMSWPSLTTFDRLATLACHLRRAPPMNVGEGERGHGIKTVASVVQGGGSSNSLDPAARRCQVLT